MALSKLGNYIQQSTLQNDARTYDENFVVGISTQKMMIPTKANLDGVNLSSYKLVPPRHFAYVPDTSRRGDKMSLCYNDTENTYLVSSISIVFCVNNENLLNPQYLFIYFNRPEFDRYSRFNSWGSARETFTWEDMRDIDIDLPPLSIQQKYVDVYNAMLANQQSYERGLDDLKLVCDAYIEDLRRKIPCESLENYIYQKNDRNTDKSIDFVMGLSTRKEFRKPQSRVNRDELGNYKIVNPFDFAFVPTTDSWKVLAFAFNLFGKDIVVSPIYEVFSINKDKLLPEYLAMWLSRKEFDRYVRFYSWGSARENFSYEDMGNVRIPIPEKNIQKNIVDIYSTYKERKSINEKLKTQLKNICPILIKGSIEEARRNENVHSAV